MSYIGLDIGTSGCKAVVFNESGVELASAYREYPVRRPMSNWAELDSEEVMTKCFEIITELNSMIDDPVSALGISAQARRRLFIRRHQTFEQRQGADTEERVGGVL